MSYKTPAKIAAAGRSLTRAAHQWAAEQFQNVSIGNWTDDEVFAFVEEYFPGGRDAFAEQFGPVHYVAFGDTAPTFCRADRYSVTTTSSSARVTCPACVEALRDLAAFEEAYDI